MKKIYTPLLVLAIAATYFLFTGYTGSTKESGGMFSNTGSPGDAGVSCTECHSGGATVDNTWLSTDIPVTGYAPGQVYTITLTINVSNTNPHGFSLTCENTVGVAAGILNATDAVNTQLFSNHVTHTPAGTSLSQWTCEWTAPPSGTGTVTFYAAFVKNGYSGGVVTATQAYDQEVVADINETDVNSVFSVYPNPATNNLNVSLNNIENSSINISILSMTGQLVCKNVEEVAGSDFNKSYDLSSYKKGLYYVQITNGSKSFTEKIIVL